MSLKSLLYFLLGLGLGLAFAMYLAAAYVDTAQTHNRPAIFLNI